MEYDDCMTFEELIEKASERTLSEEEAGRAMELMADGTPTPEEIEAFLRTPALSVDNVDASTLTGLVRVVRQRAVGLPEKRSSPLVDTCGTGGGASTFNVSTAAGLIIAACRGKHPELAALGVAKHGNRAIASQSGSADVLEELGMNIDLSPQKVAGLIDELGFGFLFAPKFHTAFSHVQPVRKKLAAEGLRTAFNFVGPLANPVDLSYQLVGIFIPDKLAVIADVLRRLGVRAALCVSGRTETREPMDEISISAETKAYLLRDGEFQEIELTPEDFGCERTPVDGIRADGREASAAMIREILSGKATGSPAESIVVANSAAAIGLATGMSWKESAEFVREVIVSGDAERLLKEIVERSAVDGA